jgi:chromate transporter
MKELIDLFFCFAKIGSVTFGGGYAMLPILQRELIDKRHWVEQDELMDYFAIGQCTPGIIAINVSTFIGSKRHGIPGALAATIGFVTIPVILILLIAAFLTNFAELSVVKHAFAGIRVCVCILILNAVVKLWKKSIVDKLTFSAFLVIFLLAVFSNISPALLVIAAGIAGILFCPKKEGTKK